MVQSRSDIAHLHALEARVLFAGVPLSVSSETTSIGVVLTIDGTVDGDSISLNRRSSTLIISNSTGWSGSYSGRTDLIRIHGGDGNDKISVSSAIWTPIELHGDGGNDTLVGGSGNDRLFGGEGRDALYGSAGDDVIVSVGPSRNDRISGGGGLDSFWLDSSNSEIISDATADEVAIGAVHRIDAFAGESTDYAGRRFTEPTLTSSARGYSDFSDRPLFSKSGPLADDIEQGALGDCYMLASLGSLANVDQQVIRQSIADLGDGTYAVRFTAGKKESYVRVDGQLPTLRDGSLAYAQLGNQDSTWVAIFEKAYAFFRTGDGTYASLEGGFMSDVFEDLGLKNSSYFRSNDGKDVLEQLKKDLESGDAVTVGTRNKVSDEVPILPGHAYVVEAVLTISAGRAVSVRLRNPWSEDGKGNDGVDDGFITVTADQLGQAFWFSCVAEL